MRERYKLTYFEYTIVKPYLIILYFLSLPQKVTKKSSRSNTHPQGCRPHPTAAAGPTRTFVFKQASLKNRDTSFSLGFKCCWQGCTSATTTLQISHAFEMQRPIRTFGFSGSKGQKNSEEGQNCLS